METSSETQPCKICGNKSIFFGQVDFNKHCDEVRSGKLPPAGIPVTYLRCTACGFLFTRDFDAWSHAEFGDRIYNAEYAFVDPDFAERRPAANASYIAHNFGIHRQKIRVLDYGGGEGRMMDLLRAEGFRSVNTYDPFSSKYNVSDGQKYDLITAFEVFEHVPDPHVMMENISRLLDGPQALVFFSTGISDGLIKDQERLNWWYAAPRNGHIGLHSSKSLKVLAQRHNMNFGSM
jgi:hypothetical protein